MIQKTLKNTIFAAFTLHFFLLIGQNTERISVSEWLIQPTEKELNRPLIFVDFWATWCGPCIHSMSHTKNLEAEFENDILFLYISDEPSSKVFDFMTNNNKTFFSAVDYTGKNHENFDITSLPQSVLINETGEVVWKGNPTNLDRNDLKYFISKSQNKSVLVNRVIEHVAEVKESEWKTYSNNNSHIRFTEVTAATNSFSTENDELLISGDLSYIWSFVKGINSSQIIDSSNLNHAFLFKGALMPDSLFKETVECLLLEKYSFSKTEEEEEVVLFHEKSTDLLLSSEMYDFENGDNAYLADEASLIIDNASIDEMAKLFSSFSKTNFKYVGSNSEKYDWNLILLNDVYTIETFSEELNFEITKEKQMLTNYYISFKN